MKKASKVLALLLAFVLAVSVFAACKPNEAPASSKAPDAASKTPDADKGKEEVTISLAFGEHATQLYHPDTWVIAPWAKEKFNVKLALTAIPSTDYATKMNTMIAGDDFPDILMGVNRDVANEYGTKGTFLNMAKYLDQMTNLQARMKDLSFLKPYMEYKEGEMYAQPASVNTAGDVGATAQFVAFARKDIMDELGIEAPKTFDDLHNMFKKMKEAYPDTYPWINRLKLSIIVNVLAPGLGINVAPAGRSRTEWGVWNAEEKKFTSIMDEKNFRWFLGWMNDLFDEGLLDPSYAVDDTSVWQDKLNNSKGFFSIDYFSRPDTMNQSGKLVYDKFDLEAFLTPALPEGKQKVYANVGVGNSNVFNSKCENPERLMELVDNWFFSEEGSLLTTYGVEGKTFKKGPNKTLEKIYSDEAPTSLDFDAVYGCNYLTFWSMKADVFGYDLYDKSASETYNNTWNVHKDDQIDLPPALIYSPEESEIAVDLGAEVGQVGATIMNVFSEFIIGRRDINDDAAWDAAKQELNDAGYQEFLDNMNVAYNRMYG